MTIDTEKLPQDVVGLVIAAREAWKLMVDIIRPCPEIDALDKALEHFSSRVPYDEEPSE